MLLFLKFMIRRSYLTAQVNQKKLPFRGEYCKRMLFEAIILIRIFSKGIAACGKAFQVMRRS